MRENRHLRFADIDGLGRHDLAIAAEVWLDDLSCQNWVTRDIIKLGNHFKRYLDRPDPQMMTLGQVERDCNTEKAQIVDALRQMYAYGVVSGYAIEHNIIRVSLNLTLMQRLRVLEIRKRWSELRALFNGGGNGFARQSTDSWLNEPIEADVAAIEA